MGRTHQVELVPVVDTLGTAQPPLLGIVKHWRCGVVPEVRGKVRGGAAVKHRQGAMTHDLSAPAHLQAVS
jgi:hypothetical protein